jgi:tetratricopeptide (TPR) repeat protein
MVRVSDGSSGFVSRFRGRINAEAAAGAVSAAAVLGAVAAFCLTCVTDSDLFWHLATGDLIRRTGQVPTSDTFSYTAYGLPWVDIHWLYQVLVSYLHEVAGLAAVELAKTLIVVGLFAWLWRRGRRAAGPALCGAMLLLAALACQERFLTRPEIVSWWLLAATLALLTSADDAQAAARRRRLLWIGLPLLVVLWVNVQGLFVLAPALTGLALVAAAARAARRPAAAWDGPAAPGTQAGDLLASVALQSVAALINPVGARALRLPFEEFFQHLGGRTLLSRTIAEFRPTLSGYLVTPAIVAFVAFAALTAVVLAAGGRRAPLFDWLVAGATFYVALRARRNIPIFVIAAVPIALRHAAPRVAALAAGSRRRSMSLAGTVAVTAAAALLIVSVATNQFYLHPPTERWFGVGLIPDYFPEESARFVDRARLPGRVFSSLWAGGYLIKAWDRDRQVFIDGRNDPFLHGVLESYLKAIADPEYFLEMVEKYQITAVLWPHQRALEARPLLKWLAEGHGWVMEHLDPGGVVFVRNDMMTPTLQRLGRFGTGRPRDALYADLRRQIAAEPFAGPPIREVALGEFFSTTGDPQGAAEFLRPAVEALPRSATLRQEYGLALERQGKRAEARAAYEEAARLDPRLTPALVALGAMALEDGDRAGAEARLDRARDLGDRSALLFGSRARLAETAGLMSDAAALWDQAVAAAPASRGVLLEAAAFKARQGDRDGALAIYDRLLRLDPADEEAARARSELAQSNALGTPRGSRP